VGEPHPVRIVERATQEAVMKMRKMTGVAVAVGAFASIAAVGVAAPAAPSAPTAQATATRQFEGTVVSVNRSARSFRLRDSERGTATIRVTSRTRFERLAGFSSLRRGQTRIEARVRRSNGTWVATEVERSGGGGRHGGGGRGD
jgi:hypothetical protein